MRKVIIKILDEVNCIIIGLIPDHIEWFVKRYAKFTPNYFFNPKFKLGNWDGKVKYFYKSGKTFTYLLPEIVPKLKAFDYKMELIDLREFGVDVDFIDKNHFAHIKNPENDEPFILRYYQVDGVNALIENGGGVVLAGTGAGKDQPLTSKILTPNGWTTMGNIQVGDEIFTPKGTTTRVIGVFPQGNQDVYEIQFHDGSKTKCGIGHLWKVKYPKHFYTSQTENRIVQTKDIIEFLNRKSSDIHTPGNVSIPLVDPIEYSKKDIILDPYLLGVLIGDGTFGNSQLVSSADESILCYVRETIKPMGLHLVHSENVDYRISKQEKQKTFPPSSNELTETLKVLGLYKTKSYNKFIPSLYKIGSIKQRFDLIRGLMDTDGTVDKKGSISFTTTSQRLAKDFQEIIWSLGGTCTITQRQPTYIYKENKKIGRVAYTCFVRHVSPSSFFSLERKQKRCRRIHADGRIELARRIKSITKISYEPTQCIMIDDPEHLYITDDYTITHNTIMNAALCDAYNKQGLKTLTIVPSQDLVVQTKNDFILWELDTGEYTGDLKDLNHQHVVSTWQALQHNPNIVKMFQVVVVDECHGLKGQELTSLLNDYGKNIQYRFGLTGTLPKAETDAMAVHIAVGPVVYEIPAYQLQREGYLADMHIDIYQLEENLTDEYQEFLKHTDFEGEKPPTYIQFKNSYYPEWSQEKSHLITYKPRLEWIKEFIEIKKNAKKGNVFCLVDSIPFGKRLAKMIDDAVFVYGKDKKTARKQIYELFRDHNNLVVIANVRIAGQGLNVKRIFNMMFIDIGKSFIRTIQTIGRGLRKAKDKDFVNVSDICSDLKYGRRHLVDRTKYYREAKYKYKKHVVKYDE